MNEENVIVKSSAPAVAPPSSGSQWVKIPDQPGDWVWERDDESDLIIVEIAGAQGTDTLWASIYQHGWTDAQNVDEMEGWWLGPIMRPSRTVTSENAEVSL